MFDQCRLCDKKDIRELQERYNKVHLALNRMARALDVEGTDIDDTVIRLNKYADQITLGKARTKRNREEQK